MKTPQFEELAQRWRDEADFYIVYTREAHAKASGAERLGKAADMLMGHDRDGDNAVSRAEFEGPQEMFEPFDLDADGVVRSYELLAARKITQFEAIDEPTTLQQRRALARRFRSEVPGEIPILVDELDNRTSLAYGGMPNSMFVIRPEGTISHAFDWASVREAERALSELSGREPPPALPRTIEWGVVEPSLANAERRDAKLLLQFGAPGCGACTTMATTLADPTLQAELDAFEHVELGVERDDAWALFEALDLAATPAFVIVDPRTREVLRSTQGVVGLADFERFLAG